METDEQSNSQEGTLEIVEEECGGGTKKYIITCTCTDYDGQKYSLSKECTNNDGLCICSDPKHPQVMCDLPWQSESLEPLDSCSESSDNNSESASYTESRDSNAYGNGTLY
jgi:hypothetical protein